MPKCQDICFVLHSNLYPLVEKRAPKQEKGQGMRGGERRDQFFHELILHTKCYFHLLFKIQILSLKYSYSLLLQGNVLNPHCGTDNTHDLEVFFLLRTWHLYLTILNISCFILQPFVGAISLLLWEHFWGLSDSLCTSGTSNIQ